MAKRIAISHDPDLLKPVVEALIFASEEPLAPRMLVRLLSGESNSPEAEVEPVAEAESTEAESMEAESAEAESAEAEGTESEGAEPGEDAQQSLDDLTESFRTANRRGRLQIDGKLVRQLVDELNEEYEEDGRAFRIVEVAGGFQFATIREYGEYVAMLSKDKARRRLSPAALETLAIIAYRQPVSKPEIESIRGVNCDQVLLSLLEKTLVAITGRGEGVGRPLLYGTTDEFLRSFGLRNVSDLPKLREIEELMEQDTHSPEHSPVIDVNEDMSVEEIEEKVAEWHPSTFAEASEADPPEVETTEVESAETTQLEASEAEPGDDAEPDSERTSDAQIEGTFEHNGR